MPLFDTPERSSATRTPGRWIWARVSRAADDIGALSEDGVGCGSPWLRGRALAFCDCCRSAPVPYVDQLLQTRLTLAVSSGTKIATDFPVRSVPVPRNAPATFAPAPGSSIPPMMIPFAPTSAAFFLIDFIIPLSVVNPVLPAELSRATSVYVLPTLSGDV